MKRAQKQRKTVPSDFPEVLTEIHKDDINLIVWKKNLSKSIIGCASPFIAHKEHLKTAMTPTLCATYFLINQYLASFEQKNKLYQHVNLLVRMFCTIFELKLVGLQLMILDRTMCAKFHVDKESSRLITTLTGNAAEWFNNEYIDRTILDANNKDLTDEDSGLLPNSQSINQLSVGDVSLLKEKGWHYNTCGELAHCSPPIKNNEPRLLFIADFIE